MTLGTPKHPKNINKIGVYLNKIGKCLHNQKTQSTSSPPNFVVRICQELQELQSRI